MTEAETILKLIEEVDPKDSDKLDEIDARVWAIAHGISYEEENRLREYGKLAGQPPKYTRSRDALKSIRPEGWEWDIYFHYGTPYVTFTKMWPDPINIKTPDLPTEELAELHAIIQAIEYERGRA